MKRTITIAAATLFAAVASMAEIRGAWTATSNDEKPGRIHMNLSRGRTHNFGHSMNVADFTGLSTAQVSAATSTPTQFQLVRDAGTVSFEGSFKNGDGAGHFTFAANRAYPDAVRALGVKFDLDDHHDNRGEEDNLFTLAMLDVSTAYIKSIQAEGYRVSLDKYLSMRIFNVTPEYIREMRSLGFRELSADDLISTRVHRVTPEYVRKMRAAGWDLTLEQLMSSSIHKATPEFAQEMRNLGYGNLEHDDLVAFRIHRVTADFIRELREVGYDKLSADELVSMRIHRVTPAFIKELKAAGYSNVPVQKLIAMKIHRIDVKFIEKMNEMD